MTETPEQFASRVWAEAELLLPKNMDFRVICDVAKALGHAEGKGWKEGFADASRIVDQGLAAALAKIGGGK